jgi:putative membrane protein
MDSKKTIYFSKGEGPRFITRLFFNGLGLWIAARLSENISYDDSLFVIAIAALLFSVVNAIIRPVVVVLTLPAILLTLGLFMLVINALMVLLVSALYPPFVVDGFLAAVMAAIITWIVNYGLSMFFERSTLETSKE